MLRLHFQGLSNLEIASQLNVTPQHVSNVLCTPEAQELLAQLQENTLDTILDVQTQAQAIAPLVFEEKVRLALTAKDEKVRTTNCKDILDIAGHMPVRRVVVETPDRQAERFDKMTIQELQAEMLGELNMEAAPAEPEVTVH